MAWPVVPHAGFIICEYLRAIVADHGTNKQIFGNFDDHLSTCGLTAHLRVGQEMRNVWLDFLYGRDAWEGCFKGTATTFGIGGMRSQSFDQCRDWASVRHRRLEVLRDMGVAAIIRLVTSLYP